MGLAIDDHAGPAVADNADMGALNPSIGVQEVVGEFSSEELEGVNDLGGLCKNVAGVLDRVGGNDSLVGSLGVGGGERGSREQAANGQVVDAVDLGVTVNLEEADPVLSVLLLVEVNVDGGVGHVE